MGILDLLSRKPTKDRYARLFTQAMRDAGETRAIEYDEASFSLYVEGGQRINLENIWRVYCSLPRGERASNLERCVSGLNETDFPETWSEAAPNILPLVRTPEYWEFTVLEQQIRGEQALSLPSASLGEGLFVYLAFDRPDSIGFVNANQLAKWNVSFDEAMEVARDNLRKKSTEPFKSIVPGVYVSPWRDSYDSSRLVLHELFYRVEVKGRPVAIAPSRDVLVVTGEDDAPGMKELSDIARKVLAEPRPLSPDPLVLGEAGWTDFKLDSACNEHRDLMELQFQMRVANYQEQKRLLEALHQKTGEDVFVASYTVARNDKTGDYDSYSVWSDGVVTLLPRTRTIAFYRPSDEARVIVRWDDAIRVVGSLMMPVEMAPARFRVEKFPDAEQFAELKRLAVKT